MVFKNKVSIKGLSAIGAIVCGVLFTLTALLSIWEVNPFACFGCKSEITNKVLPSFALLTVAFIVLLTILRLMDEKK